MSFSMDLTSMFDIASQMFGSFGGIVALIGGLSIGVGLVRFILQTVKTLF